MRWLKLLAFFTLSASLGLSQAPAGSICQPLSKETKSLVEGYLAQRLVSGATAKPLIKSDETLPENCYHKLTFAMNGTGSEFVMYLSPDERFLSSTLYDLSLDPQREVARIADKVAKLLMRDESPHLSGSSSRLTIVEFVDFQCPYCKQFADWYWGLPESLRSQTTLVFKNLPLDQHPWSRSAASYAVCANLQSQASLRQITDYFFQNQSEISPENLKNKLSASLEGSKLVDLLQLQTCAAGKDAQLVVERDMAIAKQLNVTNTPTMFINGRRVFRVASAEELQHLLQNELTNAGPTETQASRVSAKP